ncbi:unnamed protein product, partial [Iphiclides podalirius]
MDGDLVVAGLETSPEESGSVPQRPRVEVRKCRPAIPAPAPPRGSVAPPIAGILAAPSSETSSGASARERAMANCSKLELLDIVRNSLDNITSIVTSPESKLNKTDINAVGGCVREVLAVVAALNIRLSDAEHDVAEANLMAAK